MQNGLGLVLVKVAVNPLNPAGDLPSSPASSYTCGFFPAVTSFFPSSPPRTFTTTTSIKDSEPSSHRHVEPEAPSPSLRGLPIRRPLSTLRGKTNRFGPRSSIVRPGRIPQAQKSDETPQQPETPVSESQDTANPNYDPSQNTLLAPVYLPEDPNGVLKETHPATKLLANSALVVQRQLELMNVMM